jgi:acylphosphatase
MGGAKVKTKIKALNKISEIADEILIGHLIEKEIQEQNFEVKNPQKVIGPIDSLRQDEKDLDIGQETIHLFEKKILIAKTIFWNGPLGDINSTRFAQGSSAISKAIIASGAYSIVGGGDTVGFLGENDIREKFNFLSSGGGAMLVFLAGEPLPGLEALSSLEIEDRSNFVEKIRIHIFVSGKVQGVFFRDSTVKQAEKLGVFGWIQNLENGIVEAVFEGDKDKVDKIVKWVRKGPFFAKVKEIDVDQQRYTGEFKDFQIKYPELAETLKQAE